MKQLNQTILRDAFAQLPGWVFLLAGLVTVMACLIMPALQEHRMMQWRKQTLATQAQLLQSQAGIYKRFDTALLEEDPILLQRLAYTQLGLIPQGTGSLQFNQPLPPIGESTYSTQHTDGWFSAHLAASTSGQDVYESVLEPGVMPQTSAPPQQINSSLARLTTGSLQPW
ncbi:MAG: hypothetical protein JKX85_14720, partial [Phycisphaeraceae bacterium]|nr:hypothetical protein [Phycisphaeraceae bacterium]